MSKRDLYEVLGVARDADEATIKAAYKRQAFKTHPDRPGGSHDAHKELEHAYEDSPDPATRARYDETGEDATAPEIDPVEQVLLQVMLEIMKDTYEGADMIKEAVTYATAVLNGYEDVVSKLRMAAAKLEKKRGRITTTEKDNLFEMVLQSKIDENAVRLLHHEKMLELSKAALDRLKAYKDTKAPKGGKPTPPRGTMMFERWPT